MRILSLLAVYCYTVTSGRNNSLSDTGSHEMIAFLPHLIVSTDSLLLMYIEMVYRECRHAADMCT